MCQRLSLDGCPNNDHVESNIGQMNAEAHAFKKQKFLEFQKFHYISMINALVSNILSFQLRHFICQFFLAEKNLNSV